MRRIFLRNIGISNIDSTTSRIDTDVVMQESLLPRVSETLGSSSLVDLIFTRAENQMDTWKPDGTKIMQEFQGFDNEDFDVTKCLFDDVQNSKLRFMTCREVFLFGLEFTDQPSVANWLAEPETKLVVVLLLLPALQPAPISNSLLTKEERSRVEVAESSTLYLRV